jgi:nitroimidazol reductase NimA-like FMN-containing flavoprotein (pyridoxamine 5'-phosphate oxidase superfamily)
MGQIPNEPLVDEGLEILDEEQCMELLATSSVGRIGVSIGALPAIFTVNFMLCSRDIIFKTSEGTKLAAAANHAVVAFHCDMVDPVQRAGWSVLVVGRAIPVVDIDQVAELDRSGLDPWAGGNRRHFVRIPVEFVSGRRIVPAPEVG